MAGKRTIFLRSWNFCVTLCSHNVISPGPNIMQGYLNMPEATASTIDSEGYLHTGDVAVLDEHGTFAIVDRVKELIKYKGFQVCTP